LFSFNKFIGRASDALIAASVAAGSLAVPVSAIAAPTAPSTAPAATAKTPQRIISLSPSATEILWGIGAAKQVIAVDDNSNFPAGVPTTMLSSFNPNVEALSAYQPDLVILQANATKAADVATALAQLGIKVWVEPTPNTPAEAYAEFTKLGKLTGHATAAAKLVGKMKQQIAAIIKGHRAPKVRVFHELDNTLYTATSKTFIGAVYRDFGVTNIADAASDADQTGYPQLSDEYILKANPQAIFLSDADYGENPATVAARAGWSSITAVKNAKVFTLSADVSSRWGPRLVDLYRSIGSALAKVK